MPMLPLSVNLSSLLSTSSWAPFSSPPSGEVEELTKNDQKMEGSLAGS
jgi:hypothetical protein